MRLFQARAVLLKSPDAKPYLRAAVKLALKPTELFFDVEVDPLRDVCYLHGIVERRGGNSADERFVAFFAEAATPEAERDTFARAFAYLSGLPDAGIYYYSKYERTAYRKLQAKYSDVCSAEDVERLFDPARARRTFAATLF